MAAGVEFDAIQYKHVYAIRGNNDRSFANPPQREFILTEPDIVSACTVFIIYLGPN